MNDCREELSGEGGGRFHIVQPLRDPESNWAVDVAKNLEEYLLKICSGEVTGDEESSLSVNFAEAALLLQGSVQVYSRKVEYLYSLVLHALEFISQKRQQDQAEKTSVQPEGNDSIAVADEENEPFLDLNDVPVEAKNCLDLEHNKDDTLNQFVKPPANLVVLEGDCLDTSGDAGELESYLLATHDLYEDFILLDACDAEAVQNFLKGSKTDIWSNISRRGSSARSKSRKSFLSPTRQSGGSACKSSHREKENANLNNITEIPTNTEVNDDYDVWPDPVFPHDLPEDEINVGYSDPMDDYSDEDDPLKLLNPYEPGNLKVKPFKKVKIRTRQKISSSKSVSSTSQFPVAKIHGTVSPEFMEVWEAQVRANEKLRESLLKKKRLEESQSPPLYDKLRESLTLEGRGTYNAFNIPDDENLDDEYEDNTPDMDMPENIFMDPEEPMDIEKNDDDGVCFGGAEVFTQDDPDSHENLEDLCRSHLDALLASIAETQTQTELAKRVSTWKQRIENALEEQDSHPPFDIHEYGERVLDKLSLEGDNGGQMSFADVVSGQEKHDVARTFSALLQLVNNGNVDLDRGESCDNPVCHTAVNPFYVQLIHHDKRQKEVRRCSSKKRLKSPIGTANLQVSKDKPSGDKCSRVFSSSAGFTSSVNSSRSNGKYSLRLGKVSAIRCTPEGKRRRRSNMVEPVDLHL